MRLTRKRRRRPAAVLAVPAALAVTALTGTYLLRRRSRPATTGAGGSERREWRCLCGQELRVAGDGRHRVFWLADAALDDPILGDLCPSCERDLLAQD